MAILEVQHISKSFGNTEVLKDISFSLEKGKVLSMIGSSGSGKTTLLRCLNFLEQPDGGVIRVNGETLFDAANPQTRQESEIRRKRLHFGLVFQSFNLFPQYTALQNVMLAKELLEKEKPDYKARKREIHEQIEQEAKALLDQMGLSDRMTNYPHQLSGGMRQRVLIAMAFACNPHLIIADEPTTALDVTIQAQVLDILKELQRKQKTSLMLITHDLSIVMNMADKIYVMYCGKIVECARTRELFKNPLHPYTHGLLGSVARINDDRKRFVQIPSSLPSPMHKPSGCYFHPRCVHATERCKQEMPPLGQLEGGRCVRCWNYKEIRYDKQ